MPYKQDNYTIMGKLERHNEAVAAKHGIPAEKISEAALNPDWFAKRIEAPWQRDLAPGVTLSGESLSLGGEDFTNVYDIRVAPDSPAQVELLSFPNKKKPTHIFRDAPDLIAIANASFFT